MATKHYVKDYDTFKSTLVHELCHLIFMEQLPFHTIKSLNIWATHNLDDEHCFFSGSVISEMKMDKSYYLANIEMCIAGYYGAKIICDFQDKIPSSSDFETAYHYANLYAKEFLNDTSQETIEEFMNERIKHVEEQITKYQDAITYVADSILEEVADFELTIDRGLTISKYIIDKKFEEYFESHN